MTMYVKLHVGQGYLNPCSNGMTIECNDLAEVYLSDKCLNPCSNGMTIESGGNAYRSTDIWS